MTTREMAAEIARQRQDLLDEGRWREALRLAATADRLLGKPDSLDFDSMVYTLNHTPQAEN